MEMSTIALTLNAPVSGVIVAWDWLGLFKIHTHTVICKHILVYIVRGLSLWGRNGGLNMISSSLVPIPASTHKKVAEIQSAEHCNQVIEVVQPPMVQMAVIPCTVDIKKLYRSKTRLQCSCSPGTACSRTRAWLWRWMLQWVHPPGAEGWATWRTWGRRRSDWSAWKRLGVAAGVRGGREWMWEKLGLLEAQIWVVACCRVSMDMQLILLHSPCLLHLWSQLCLETCTRK